MTAITQPDATARLRSPRALVHRALGRLVALMRAARDRMVDAGDTWQLGGDPEVDVGRRTGARI